MSIPIQSECNPNLPDEHVLWALVGLAGPSANAPLVVPVSILRKWSQHLYRCGLRHDPELQEIKYVPPQGPQDWIMSAGGSWVDVSEELPAEVTAPDTSHLSAAEKRILLDRLSAELTPDNNVQETEAAISYDE